MSDDWKEIEDVSQSCSDSNGWCGWCGTCREHAEWIHERDRSIDEEY